MKKKTALILGLFLLVLLAAGYTLYASLTGSPLHRLIFTGKAKRYVAEQYPQQEFAVSFATYNFKDNTYRCRAQSAESVDTAFDVYETRDGAVHDDYASAVEGRENTIARLSQELDRTVEALLIPAFPHRTRLILCDFCFEEPFDLSRFALDMPLTLEALPHPAELTVWAETSGQEPSWDEAEQMLRELYLLTDQLDLDVQYFSISVEYPYDDADGARKPTDYSSIVGADAVPRALLAEDGEGLAAFLQGERARREQEAAEIARGEASGKDA